MAQREHYLAGEVSRFCWRWWRSAPINWLIGGLAFVALILTGVDARWGFVVAAALVVGPVGLAINGVTSPLAWTPRLRRVAIVVGSVLLAPTVLGAYWDISLLIVAPVFAIPLVVDGALRALAPYERSQGKEWVDRAAAKLAAIGPEVVAITGSYGKTTTKNYVAHLLAGTRRVVASPASFNNRMGLARAINENLTPGTEVFVAEMGTYGYGEIAELCEWIPPKVAAMVAIGPVHLERFRSLDHIARAKSEILDKAEVGVICVDYAELRQVSDERRTVMKIIDVSAVDGVVIDGDVITEVPHGVFGANLAVALGICCALGVDLTDVMPRVGDLPTAEHRQSVLTAAGGFTIIDDTFNSNPDGARSALGALASVAGQGATAVITPGMVELGEMQEKENEIFAAEAAGQVDHLVIVGRTNRRSLLRGSSNGRASVTVVASREEAVAWATENLGPGDSVLYENDLPDHYP